MRELKFRAWDKENKKFLTDTDYKEFVINMQGQAYIVSGYFDNAKVDEYNGVEILQYTGLKDRKRREIYEGDIVEFWNYGYAKCRIAKVKFNTERGRWILFVAVGRHKDLTAEKAGECEVVGNIYENSELLK